MVKGVMHEDGDRILSDALEDDVHVSAAKSTGVQSTIHEGGCAR